MINIRFKLSGWMSCDIHQYTIIFNMYGGNFCTHPKLLTYLSEKHGVKVNYYYKVDRDVPIAAFFLIEGKGDYKNKELPFVFDDLIYPIKKGCKVYLPFKVKRISPIINNYVINSFSHKKFKKRIAYVKDNFSSKSVRKRSGELKRFISSGGQVKDFSLFTTSELVNIYRKLFLLRWEETVYCPSYDVLYDVFDNFRDMIFGYVVLHKGEPCAFDLNYIVECQNWIYIDDYNGGLNPSLKDLGIGSLLLWSNISQAKELARSRNKNLVFSLGAYNEAWSYKQQWCAILPSGRTVF
ncbi:transcriptional regulator [Nissabacter sp. SGAir0207]|uniref:transcriptional regulator n=1 Tax=Nissabacter sp. SGAir0207 TaxID=2126321 RepID=UPI0010CCF1DE|nr:transcriptional regulator [Nissabacter sp. SGAir0207]QCR38617.1 transcriptional regulator [Nissabacter sp. SGAir0207]